MCKHKHKTIVYYEGITDIGNGPEEIFFTAFQCDDCGMLLEAASTEDVLAVSYEPPTLDKAAYWNALKHAARAVVESAKEVQNGTR